MNAKQNMKIFIAILAAASICLGIRIPAVSIDTSTAKVEGDTTTSPTGEAFDGTNDVIPLVTKLVFTAGKCQG